MTRGALSKVVAGLLAILLVGLAASFDVRTHGGFDAKAPHHVNASSGFDFRLSQIAPMADHIEWIAYPLGDLTILLPF